MGIGSQSLFLMGFAASFAAKLADTFGSEIGKRFGKDTYLVTSLEKVERGTEGGISLEGTLASVLGSIFMTFIAIYRCSKKKMSWQYLIVPTLGVVLCPFALLYFWV